MAEARLSLARDGGRVSVLRGGALILTYHGEAPDPSTPWRTNFIQPICARSGAVLTEDAPADHRHHRGLFWAWRRVTIDGADAGDGWVGRDLLYDIEAPRCGTREDGAAEITSRLVWRSAKHPPFMREDVRIVVAAGGHTRIDVEVRLRALVEGVTIAGTDDEKGYSGPSIRFAQTEALRMESDGRVLTPRLGAVDTGAAVDFSWAPRPAGFPSCVSVAGTVDGRAWTRWVLRERESMQNCACPGRAAVAVPTAHDRVLTLSLVITD